MKHRRKLNALSATILAILVSGSLHSAEPLQIVVSDKGLQSLTYQGAEYCDPSGAGVLGFNGGHEYGNLWVPAVLDPQKVPQ